MRQAFPGLPVILGGIEASLRRAAHYDFWSDSVRRSLLLDAKADLILYGMAESTLIEVARRLRDGIGLEGLPGAAYIGARPAEAEVLPSYEDILARPAALLEATVAIERQVHQGTTVLAQAHGDRFIILTPPPAPGTADFERIADLPFTRDAHPDCGERIPGLDMVRWSVTAVRGCGGGCSFCALALHQGRRIRSRSQASVLREIRAMTQHPEWSGAVTDVGGPTANFWGAACGAEPSRCLRPSCLSPGICPHLQPRQREYLGLLRAARAVPGVKHVRVASGVRHDLALEDAEFARGLTAEFVGGQLKLAPEHCVDHVLKLMRKSDFSLFERFLEVFGRVSAGQDREQYVVPYVMSAFPGCSMDDMTQLAAWFRAQGWQPQQVQCFVPTPGTVATAMFYAGCDAAGHPIHVARTDREREDQHRVLFPDRHLPPGQAGAPRRPTGAGRPPRPGTSARRPSR